LTSEVDGIKFNRIIIRFLNYPEIIGDDS